jgi:hypothetical protein
MQNEQIKGEREVRIFREFLATSQLPIDPYSVQKRSPPEPDILCTHAQEGLIAFELVEICDPNLASLKAMGEEADGVYVRTADPSRQIISRKLRRRYETQHPIELLCYTRGRVVTPPSTIIPTILPYLNSWRHTFRKVWLFSGGKVHHIWSEG